MADFAGARIAIKERLVAGWTTTPIASTNKPPPPTADEEGNPVPWVFLEIGGAGSAIVGAGLPGSHVTVHDGLISVHVFVPVGSDDDLAFQYAGAIGEIFRTSVFYNSEPGTQVRCWTPRIDGGGSGDDDGNWFRVTVTIPFEFWFLA